MKDSSVISKFALMAISVAIFFLYIVPTLKEIGVTQDNIALYNQELTKVKTVNDQLANLLAQVNSVPTSKQQDLITYLPDEVDSASVMKDLKNIAQLSGVVIESLTYEEADDVINYNDVENLDDEELVAHEFIVSGNGFYDNIKDYLRNLEKNKYQFDIANLMIEASDTGGIDFEITANVYSLKTKSSRSLSVSDSQIISE